MTPLLLSTLIITIDDGPAPQTGQILRVLARHRVQATFYVLGSRLQTRAGRRRLKAIARAGHLIGNHLYSHRSPRALGPAGVIRELRRTDKAIRAALCPRWCYVIRRWYRPPHGHRSAAVERLVRRQGYQVRMWDISSWGQRPRALWRRIRRRLHARRRTVLLFHADVWRLAWVLTAYRNARRRR